MAELTTVPTFFFYQGETGSLDWERPVQVSFYNGSISLEQEGEYEVNDRISLSPVHFEKLFKEIKKHLPAAMEHLKK